jgi:hypothetical protein
VWPLHQDSVNFVILREDVSHSKDDLITVADQNGRTYSALIDGSRLRVGHLVFTPAELHEAKLRISACQQEEATQLQKMGFFTFTDGKMEPKRD